MRYARLLGVVLAAGLVSLVLAGCCGTPSGCQVRRQGPCFQVDPCRWWDPGTHIDQGYVDPLR